MAYEEQLTAIRQAEKACQDFLDEVAKWKYAAAQMGEKSFIRYLPREMGAVKRASMNLTRKLVAVRQAPTF